MIIIVGFIIVLAVFAEQYYRNRRFEMLYYKNDHRFSIVVAVRYYHHGLERLFEHAKKSKHQWIFINVNEAINADDHPELIIKSLWVDDDPKAFEHRTELLSKAYALGYEETSESFLLFMDAVTRIQKFKTLDFMANNLVEHQLFTAKPTRLRKAITSGHSLFFDLLNDMNYDRNDINYHFFAIKRDTYKLAGCDDQEFSKLSDFEDAIFKKNISITHINHGESLEQVIEFNNYKEGLHFYAASIVKAERLKGLNIMPLMMLALHVFYAIIIFQFEILAVLFFLLAHLLMYVVYKPFLQHNLVSYLLAPIYLVYFDLMLLLFLFKRVLYRRSMLKQPKAKKEVIDFKLPDENTVEINEDPEELKEDQKVEPVTSEAEKPDEKPEKPKEDQKVEPIASEAEKPVEKEDD